MNLQEGGGRVPIPRRAWAAALGGIAVVLTALLGCSRSEPAPSVSRPPPPPPSPTCAERLRIDLIHPGASPAEVEAMDVIPVEVAVGRLEVVEHVDSTVAEGRAVVWVAVSSSAEQAAWPVLEALQGLTTMLPMEAEPPRVTVVRVPRSWLVVLARGPAEPLTAVADALEHTVAAIPGTHRVRRHGRATSVLSIEPDPTRLSALGLDASMLAEAVERARHPIDEGMLVRAVRPMGLEDLGNIELARREGVPLRLGDVATLRHERVHEGSRAWAGGTEAELWVVEADDADAIRRAVDSVAAPPGVSVSVAGELTPRGCPSPSSPRELGGDFELLEFALPPGFEPSRAAAELVGRAPVANDAVWWTMDPLLDDADPPDPTRVQVLIPTTSPHRTELLAWTDRTAGLELRGRYGPGRAHVVLALRHPDLERLRDGATWMVEVARARGLQGTSETTWSPQLDVKVDRHAVPRMGVSVADVLDRIRAAQRPREVGFIDDGGTPLPVRIVPVGKDGPLAQDPAARLAGIQVPTPSGASVSLSSLVRIERTMHPNRIERSDQSRVRYVRIWIEAEQKGSTEAAMDGLMPALRDAFPDVEVHREP